jgi:hypothetical protein
VTTDALHDGAVAEIEALRWLHVHETWLPQAVMAQGPYDF